MKLFRIQQRHQEYVFDLPCTREEITQWKLAYSTCNSPSQLVLSMFNHDQPERVRTFSILRNWVIFFVHEYPDLVTLEKGPFESVTRVCVCDIPVYISKGSVTEYLSCTKQGYSTQTPKEFIKRLTIQAKKTHF